MRATEVRASAPLADVVTFGLAFEPRLARDRVAPADRRLELTFLDDITLLGTPVEREVPSEALLRAMRRCGAAGAAEQMVTLQRQGREVEVRVRVPHRDFGQVTGGDIVRAVGSDMDCFTPELRGELSRFVVVSSPPILSYEIVPAPSPPPPTPPAPAPPPPPPPAPPPPEPEPPPPPPPPRPPLPPPPPPELR